MNRIGENQHYVSRVLLKRFKLPSRPLECYQVETGEWKPRSINNVCASRGYHQLLFSGTADNTLEGALSKIESRLPRMLKALDRAAQNPKIQLPLEMHETLSRYCALLKLSSPAAKAAAVVNFVYQINVELESGAFGLIRDLQVPETTIAAWKAKSKAGFKIIVDPTDALQLLYRNQFARVYSGDAGMFSMTKWTLSRSPIDLPLSDVGLVPLMLEDMRVNYYVLPLAPHLLLEGIFFFELRKNRRHRPVERRTLTEREAEYRLDIICASAVKEIICSRKIEGVAESIRRAHASGISFLKIMNFDDVADAGLANACQELRFGVVPTDDFVKFVHSYVRPRHIVTPIADEGH
jgi:hypothetical protein